MKVAYVTIKDARNLGRDTEWSGTGYYIARSLARQGIEIDYLGPLADSLSSRIVRSSKRLFYQKLQHKLYLKDTDPFILKNLADCVSQKLAAKKYDLVLSATVNPIAYLECDLPIVFWADATFVNTAEFYPEYSNLCAETVENGHKMERKALERCKFAVYSSEWAAKAAINYYQGDSSKVRILNFGANLDSQKSLAEIEALIKARPKDKCRLLFLGKDWLRKGGNKAFEVAKALNKSGLRTELTVVGCQPNNIEEPIPEYVKSLGFISKFSSQGREKLIDLIANSHFLILPTTADCSPIVLSEACSLGVPCISTSIGGIPSIVKNGTNGQLFSLDSTIENYVKYILNLFYEYTNYQSLALSSFEEYCLRLNWKTAGKELNLILKQAAKSK